MKLVGEEGPELIVDKGGYDILTAQDSEQIMKIMAGYGVPTQFKNTAEELHSPLRSIKDITKSTAFDKVDWSPLLNSSDLQRRSLGKKLDRVNMNLEQMSKGLTHRMTKA